MKRKKAQDVFNDSEFLLGTKTTFRKTFPEIKVITVEIEETGEGVYHSYQPLHFDKKSIGEFINCSNPLCYNGGFRIGRIICDMVSEKETDKEDSAFCQGNQGSPQGRKTYKKCLNCFDYKIHIKYRELKKLRKKKTVRKRKSKAAE